MLFVIIIYRMIGELYKMKKSKILSLLAITFMMSLSFGNVSNAADTTCTKEIFETIESARRKDVILTNEDTGVKPDAYEPNNSKEEAYPYNQTKKLTGNVFIEGYRNSNCHVEGDEDFFYVTLYSGTKYDVVLKNLYRENRHIYIWEENPDGTWTRWGKRDPVAGQPEHYYFTPKVTMRYYIQITGGKPDPCAFFFAVERVGTINPALWPYEVF